MKEIEVSFLSKDVSIISFDDEEGTHQIHSLQEIPLEDQLELEEEYLEVRDTSEADIREESKIRFSGEGGVHIQPPSKFTWAAIAAIFTVVVSTVTTMFNTYHEQMRAVERLEDRVTLQAEKLAYLEQNTYTKHEEDLRYENLADDLRRHEQSLNRGRQ